MNIKTTAIAATLALTASAGFASSDENHLLDNYLDAKANAQQVSEQIETNPNVNYNTSAPINQKLEAYETKVDALENQFDVERNTVTNEAN
ncbi:hypothetical protein [Marinomonas ostreistagni]|uniref:hypothetical protein n=1 Tax=Marinomonas ostreistagni TaxID=359209 RepID=UPI00195288D4|nr:hypothetical protein [Marinomonas ostreistagni]MBM6551856.1 hypothetical protein [Marinomonas ostreistagni]